MLSEYTSVLKARRGSPEKKSVSARWVRQRGLVDVQTATAYILKVLEEIRNCFAFTVR